MLQSPLFTPVHVAKPLRPYQADALERASEATEKHSSILVVMPTGTGKTRLAVEACARHVSKGGVPLFVAPRRELVAQASAALHARGLAPEYDVFVRTIQELTIPGATIPKVSMLVLDEARHYVADAWSKLRKAIPEAVVLGLDATPERADGRGLGGMFDVLIEALSVKSAVAQRYLVPCETIRPDHALSPGELAQSPAHFYFERCRGMSCVLFAPSVDLAKQYANDLSMLSIPSVAVYGEMPTESRTTALDAYERGEIKVLVNINVLTEGWDSPRTEVVMFARHFATQGQMLQAAGRGMRPYKTKERMLLLDLPGCTHTLGEVDDERTWHLEGRAARRASDDINVRFCPVCGAPSETVECAQCGYTGAMKKRKPRVLGLPMDRFARERGQSEEQQIKALAGYFRVAQQKGFKQFWAVKCFERKYGRRVTWELKRAAMRVLR